MTPLKSSTLADAAAGTAALTDKRHRFSSGSTRLHTVAAFPLCPFNMWASLAFGWLLNWYSMAFLQIDSQFLAASLTFGEAFAGSRSFVANPKPLVGRKTLKSSEKILLTPA